MGGRPPAKPAGWPSSERVFADLVDGTIDMTGKWHPTRSRVRLLEAFSYLGAALLVVAVIWSVYEMISGRPGVLNSLNNRCGRFGLACGTVSGFIIPFLSVALASAVFLFYRLRHVKAPVASDAKKKPHDLVQTSSRDTGRIVGRDELCNVIMEDIRDRDTRRPHLLVGGVGTGKTAVLVRLTQLLGESGAIPVPIRLRDAQKDLDFRGMAYERFQNMTERRKQNLWIPPSTGWVALEPRAQQLVADVLILLNLAERGEDPRRIEQRLQRADRGDLPPCLTTNREPLDPKRTVGAAAGSAPGTNCMDGCRSGCSHIPRAESSHTGLS
jgi:hypothetical protein